MNYILFFTLVFSSFGFLSSAWAWGGRGHDVICQTATQLVKNKDLKQFLTFRPQVMAYICNLPDVNWKGIGTTVRDLEGPTHWIDTDVVGLKPKEVPLDYQQLMAKYTGTPNLFWPDEPITSVPNKLGSLWWRADQFFRLGSSLKSDFEKVKLPVNSKEVRDEEFPYNKAIFQMFVYMGLLGHYVGDASMPYHSTADHDGWKAAQGGIHFYYEDAVVGEFPANLHDQVYKAAQKMLKVPKDVTFLKGTTLERMRALSQISIDEMPNIKRLDPIIKKSGTNKPAVIEEWLVAERKPATVGLKLFKDQIVNEMARSSLLLATLWDEIYTELGKPNLSKYRNYRYPYTLEHIAPDYQTPPKK